MSLRELADTVWYRIKQLFKSRKPTKPLTMYQQAVLRALSRSPREPYTGSEKPE